MTPVNTTGSTSHPISRWRWSTRRGWEFLLVFVVPCLLLAVPWSPHWLVRAVISYVLVLGFTIIIFRTGLGSETLIRPSEELNRPRFERFRPRVEMGCRAVVLAFGVTFCVLITVPMISDLVAWGTGEKPTTIVRTVDKESSARFAVLMQLVHFSGEPQDRLLIYGGVPLRLGDTYELVTLSHLILDFRKVN